MPGRFPIPLLFFAPLLALGLPSPASAGGLRAELDLSGAWEAVETRAEPDKPPRDGWKEAEVPGLAWGSGQGGPSFVWYRRKITVPEEWAGRRVFVRLGGAKFGARVHLDGRLLGSRVEGYSPFEVEITKRMKPGREQVLAVRCQDWSATFREGFELPERVPGELRYAPQGQVLNPVGGHFGFMGLWDDVALVARPPLRLDDVAVVTSFRNKELTVSGIVEPPRGGRDFWVEGVVRDGDREVLALEAVRVGPGGSWKLFSPAGGIRWWSPEDPYLYSLELRLLESGAAADPARRRPSREGQRLSGAAVLDSMVLRVGFKELWASGPDFHLNGVKRHLLATSGWPATKPLTRDQVRQVLEDVKAGNNVAIRFHTQPWRKVWVDVADEVGVMVIMEAALWCDSGGSYAYKDPRFWENYRRHLSGMVKRDRNNASLVMWSLENELLHCGCSRYDEKAEEKLADLGRFVKELDPFHLITYESDHDPGGVADVIGLHYPREIPWNHDFPNTCDWLNEKIKTGTGGGLMGSRDEWFQWKRDKPLYIGEYLWVPTQNGTPGTVFFGDLAYEDINDYDFRAKVAAWGPQTVAYRRAGVSGLCPWTEFGGGPSRFPLDLNPERNPLYQAQKAAYEPLAVFLRERDTRFFSGDTVVRTFDVFNDTSGEKDLTLSWRLAPGGPSDSRTFKLEPGGHRVVAAEVKIPAAGTKGDCVLAAELLAGGNRAGAVEQKCSIVPRREVKPPAGIDLLLYDPRDTGGAPLKRAGVRGRRIASLSGLPSAGRDRTILIVAPGAFADSRGGNDLPSVGGGGGASGLAEWLAAGGRALILAQDSLAGVPLGVELVTHHSTMTYPLASRHPILEGIAPEDLKFWRPGHYVTYREVRRPGRGGAKAVTVSGGGDGVGQAPVLDLPVGQGLAVLCQALVVERLSVEPVAARIIENALGYLAAYRPPAGRTVAVGVGDAFAGRLRDLGLRFDRIDRAARPDDLAGAGLVILKGGGEGLVESAPALRELLNRADVTLYWHDPDPEAFGKTGLGFPRTGLAEATGPILLRDLDNPVVNGIAREDVDYRAGSIGPSWMGARNPDPSIIGRALVPEVEEGRGRRIEAESCDLAEGTVSGDGTAVDFHRNGTASTRVKLPKAGLYSVVLVAGGTPVAGGYPLVVLKADGRAVAQVQLAEEKVRSYATLAQMPAGEFTFSASFVNDAYEPPEDRNLLLDALAIGEEPASFSGVALLAMPAALGVAPMGKGRLVVDCVRWDTTESSPLKGERYASVLLRNLGASFAPLGVAADWIPAGAFRKGEGGPYFSVGRIEISYYSWGEAVAEFECVRDGRYVVWVRGRSAPAGGEYGRARVTIDGKEAGEVELKGESAREYRIDAALLLVRGKHEIKVGFSNDGQVGSEDRNLFVTAVGFSLEK